ncbi:MAG TPA: hypothetical protein VGE97_00830 [Nitrososphaera sp.]|jgi:hypothetical protein
MARANNTGQPTDPTRQDQWLVTANLLKSKTGKQAWKPRTLGAFDKKTGGEVDSDDNKYYPGGVNIKGPISIGGRITTGNITLQRIWDRTDDEALIYDLVAAVGKGPVTIVVKSKNEDGEASGLPITYNGTLKRVSIPDFDSESGTAALMEIEIIVEGPPSVPAT